MHRPVFLLLAAQFGLAQAPGAARPDPGWFGAAVDLRPAKGIDFLWVKPGFALRGRTVQVAPLEAAAALRREEDRSFLRRVEDSVGEQLRKGLGGGRAAGELRLLSRVVEVRGPAEDGTFSGAVSMTLELRLVESADGGPVAAVHHTVQAFSESAWLGLLRAFALEFGRRLAAPAPPAPSAAPSTAAVPPLDLAATLERLERLRADGLLTEEEHRSLRRRAESKAAGK